MSEVTIKAGSAKGKSTERYEGKKIKIKHVDSYTQTVLPEDMDVLGDISNLRNQLVQKEVQRLAAYKERMFKQALYGYAYGMPVDQVCRIMARGLQPISYPTQTGTTGVISMSDAKTKTKRKPYTKGTKQKTHKAATRSELLDTVCRLLEVDSHGDLTGKAGGTIQRIVQENLEPHVQATLVSGIYEGRRKELERQAAELAEREAEAMVVPVEPEDCPAGCVPAPGDMMDYEAASRFLQKLPSRARAEAKEYCRMVERRMKEKYDDDSCFY